MGLLNEVPHKTIMTNVYQEGADLFSDLCMWVDINQQYVDLGLFPQWDDIARSGKRSHFVTHDLPEYLESST